MKINLENNAEKYVPPESAYSDELAALYHQQQQKTFNQTGHENTVPDISTIFLSEFLNKNLKQPGQVVADIGSGARADYLKVWANSKFSPEVIGVEPSKAMLEIAKKGILSDENIKIVQGDFENTGIASESVDLVVSRFSFHHNKTLEKSYAELSRILKPGGLACFVLPHPDFCAEELEKEGKEVVDGSEMVVDVMGIQIKYFYHSFAGYFENPEFKKYFKLVEQKNGDWKTGKWGGDRPNTLAFVIEKI